MRFPLPTLLAPLPSPKLSLSCSALHFFVCCIVPRRVLISASASATVVSRVASTHTHSSLSATPHALSLPLPLLLLLLHRKNDCSPPPPGAVIISTFFFLSLALFCFQLFVPCNQQHSQGASQAMKHTGRVKTEQRDPPTVIHFCCLLSLITQREPRKSSNCERLRR